MRNYLPASASAITTVKTKILKLYPFIQNAPISKDKVLEKFAGILVPT